MSDETLDMPQERGVGWADWCFDLDDAPIGDDTALWLAYFEEETGRVACCTGVRMHNNRWDAMGVYAWRYLHGPPKLPKGWAPG